MQLISTAIRWLRTITFYSSLYLRDRRVAHQLELAQDNLKRIGRRDIILFSRVPQDTSYIDFFLDYYRKMDVKHFIFIDTHGTDVTSCLVPHRDVSVWRTKSAQMSKFDVRWLNILLSRFGIERWNVVVEPY